MVAAVDEAPQGTRVKAGDLLFRCPRFKYRPCITGNLSHVFLNGHATQRYLGNMNASFAYVEGESLLMALKDVAVSSGSVCTSASSEASYVLRALNVDEDLAQSSLRFGVGRFTTDAEIDYAISLCTKYVTNLR